MKTTVNFLEAVQALQEGRCEKIKSPVGTIYSKHDYTISLEILPYGKHALGICLSCEHFLGEWELLGVEHKIVIEDVEWAQSDGAVHPYSDKIGQSFLMWKDLLNKPKMKMTLEWID